MLLHYNTQGDPYQGVAYGEQSIAIAREHNLREELAYALNDISRSYGTVGRQEEAIASAEEAGQLWQELGNLPMLTDNLGTLALGYYMIGQFDKAIAMAQEALRLSESISNLWGQAFSRFAAGPAYLEQGELGQAIEDMKEAITLGEKANFKGPELLLRPWIASIYGLLGDVQQGLEYAQLSLDHAHEWPGARPFALAALASVHLAGGSPSEATAAIEDAYQEFDPDQAGPLAEFNSFIRLIEGEVRLANQEYEGALAVADRTITTMDALGARFVLPYARRLKGQALMGLGRISEAREVLGEARTEAETMGPRRALLPILSAFTQLELQDGNPAEAANLRQQAWEVVEYIADHAGTPELRASFLSSPQVHELTHHQ